MDCLAWATSGMALATLVLAIATWVMASYVKKASREDTEAHNTDRAIDERMHRIGHLIELAHLEAEYLKGIKQDTKNLLDPIKQETIAKLKP